MTQTVDGHEYCDDGTHEWSERQPEKPFSHVLLCAVCGLCRVKVTDDVTLGWQYLTPRSYIKLRGKHGL